MATIKDIQGRKASRAETRPRPAARRAGISHMAQGVPRICAISRTVRAASERPRADSSRMASLRQSACGERVASFSRQDEALFSVPWLLCTAPPATQRAGLHHRDAHSACGGRSVRQCRGSVVLAFKAAWPYPARVSPLSLGCRRVLTMRRRCGWASTGGTRATTWRWTSRAATSSPRAPACAQVACLPRTHGAAGLRPLSRRLFGCVFVPLHGV